MTESGDEVQVVIFAIEDSLFAFEVSQVERIMRYHDPTPLPQAAEFLEGMVPYGEGVVPLVDLRSRLGVASEQGEETRIIVLLIEEQPIGVTVDRVTEVHRVDATAVAAPPKMVRGLAAKYIGGLFQREDDTVVLLNPARLFTSQERVQLTAVGRQVRSSAS